MKHFLFISFWLMTGCYHTNNPKDATNSYSYNNLVLDTITLKVDPQKFTLTIDSLAEIPLDTYEGLLMSKSFINIFEHSELYLNNTIKYLSDSTKTSYQKAIAVMTMQKQGYSKNLSFLSACGQLYKKGLVDDEILLDIIFPRLDLKNADIIKNYKNIQVRNIINDIRSNSRISSKFKNILQEILDGKTYSERRDFLEEQYSIDI